MKWLIIGTGWISDNFTKALLELNEEVIGVRSRTIESAKKFADKYGINKHVTNEEEILDDFDAAYIGTPNITHYEIAKQLIISKKNVMIEKPITHSYEKTLELYELAKEHGVKIMEAFVHITQPIARTIKGKEIRTNFRQLSSKIKNNTFESASSFRKDMFGGVIPDLGVYPIAYSTLILGKVKSFEVKDIEWMNNVVVECNINMIHESGTSSFGISKINDGDNALYVDGKKILDHITYSEHENNMVEEIKVFTSSEDLSWIHEISKEVSRVVTEMVERVESNI